MERWGGQSEVARLGRVLVKRPQEAFIDGARIEAEWRSLRFTGPPDLDRSVAEHEKFAGILRRFGAELLTLPRDAGTGLDSIYPRDAAVVCDRGVVLGSMGKAERRGEPDALGRFLKEHGLPILGRIGGEGRLEGGDVVWLDATTLLVGEGYRTNAEGIRQLTMLLGDSVDEVVSVPLPHWTGPDGVLHLMSILSPIDRDLALVHSRLMSVPFRQRLLARGLTLLEVPAGEFDSMGGNVLALAPRVCLMLEGNPETRRLLEKAGAEVLTYEGGEISRKGSGGPTCLTRPILRG